MDVERAREGMDGACFVAGEDLPAFADRRCHAMVRRLHEKEAELQSLTKEVEDEKYRNKSMEQHRRVVEQEIRAMQEAVNASTSEWESTRQLKHVSEMQIRRLRREHVGCKKEIEHVQKRRSEMHSRLLAGREKAKEFQQEKKWSASEVSQWMEGAKALLESKELAIKMTKKQEQEMRKADLKIKKASEDLMRKEEDLRQEVSNAHCAQAELNSTAAELRTLQRDCKSLAKRWMDAEAAFTNQEKQIEQLKHEQGEEHRSTHVHKEQVASLQVQLRGLQQSIQAASKASKSTQSDLETTALFVEQHQQKLRSSQDVLEEIHHQSDTVQKDKEELLAKLHEDQELVDKLTLHLDQLTRRLKKKEKATWKRLKHMEERDFQNAELEQELAKEKACLHRSQQELEAKKQRLQKERQRVEGLVVEREGLEQDIQGNRRLCKNLDGKIKDLSNKLHRQELQLNKLVEKLDHVEWKALRAQGARTHSERQGLQQQVEGLSTDLKHAEQGVAAMNKDIRQMEQDMKALTMHKEALAQELAKRQTECMEEEMCIDSMRAEIDRCQAERDSLSHQLKLQEDDVIRCARELEIEEASLLQKRKHHQDLQRSLEVYRTESEKEKKHKMRLLKEIEEEIRTANIEVQNKELKFSKLESKLEVLCQRLPLDDHTNHDANAGVRHPATVLEERKLLEGQKEELSSQLQNCQDEVAKLEEALADMVASNSHYRRIHCSGMTPEQQIALGDKKRQENALQEQLKELRNRQHSASQEVSLLQQKLDGILQQEHAVAESLECALAEKEKRAKEASACQVKFDRACQRLAKVFRKAIATKASAAYMKCLGDLHQSVLQELSEAALQHPQVAVQLDQRAELCAC